LSFAFGAFVAGMVLSESDYSHQALSNIVPLRDIFGLLFFVSVGMLLNPAFFTENLLLVGGVSLAVILGKGVIFAGLSRLFGYRNVIPLAVGLTMFQIGEFSFVLAQVGLSSGSIGDELYALVLTTAVVTMVLTPALAALVTPLYSLRRRWFTRELIQTINIPAHGLNNHVIIAGGGRVGGYIALVLQQLQLSFVIIDLDYRRIEEAKEKGYPVIFGDASEPVVLQAASIGQACLILITTPDILTTQMLVDHVRQENPTVHIVARASGIEQMQMLHEQGVYEAVQPEFEASLEMMRQALLHLNFPSTTILHYTDRIRHQMYTPLYTESNTRQEYQALAQLNQAVRLLEIEWVTLPEVSPLIGQTIAGAHIRSLTGVSVVGLWRDGHFQPNPPIDVPFVTGDIIASMGNHEQISRFRAWAETAG
jgi:monovalent cation:H+ antiporter-2, CPA2 family